MYEFFKTLCEILQAFLNKDTIVQNEIDLIAANAIESVTSIYLLSSFSMTKNITVTKSLRIKPGAIITTVGHTFNISGPFPTGLYQVFDTTGGGAVVLNHPETIVQDIWFGNTATDVRIHAALGSLPLYPTSTRGRVVQLQNEPYTINNTINITSSAAHYSGRYTTLRGYGHSGLNDGTRLNGSAGAGHAIVEMQGSYASRLENIYLEGVTSTIGIITGYADSGTAGDSAISQVLDTVRVVMPSDLTANGGAGTIAVFNKSAEQSVYRDIYFMADIPLVYTTVDTLSWIWPYTSTGTVVPQYLPFQAMSCLLHHIEGDSTLRGHGGRPALAINGGNLITAKSMEIAGGGNTASLPAVQVRSSLGSDLSYLAEGYDIGLKVDGNLMSSNVTFMTNYSSNVDIPFVDATPYSALDGGQILDSNIKIANASIASKRLIRAYNTYPTRYPIVTNSRISAPLLSNANCTYLDAYTAGGFRNSSVMSGANRIDYGVHDVKLNFNSQDIGPFTSSPVTADVALISKPAGANSYGPVMVDITGQTVFYKTGAWDNGSAVHWSGSVSAYYRAGALVWLIGTGAVVTNDTVTYSGGGASFTGGVASVALVNDGSDNLIVRLSFTGTGTDAVLVSATTEGDIKVSYPLLWFGGGSPTLTLY